jgi:hypothetical protein
MRISIVLALVLVGCGPSTTKPALCPGSVAGEACNTSPGCDYAPCDCERGVIVCHEVAPPDLAPADLARAVEDLSRPSDLAACNDVKLPITPAVQPTYVASNAPAFTGGTVADGTYVLTSAVAYTGPGGYTGTLSYSMQAVYRFGGGRVDFSYAESGSTTIASATVTTSGSLMSGNVICGGINTFNESYTATGTTILLGGIAADGTGTVETYTKQ